MAITFKTVMNPTPFGFFDSNPVFQNDADKMVTYVLRQHGQDILNVELTKKMIWSCFEQAALGFNAYMIEYQAYSNLSSLLGNQTGSIDPNDPNTANLDVNLVDNYVQPNLEFLLRAARPYANVIGYGQGQDSYSGSIEMISGKQDYDLYTDLVDSSGTPLFQYMPSGSRGQMKIVEVYHTGPIQFVFNSNMAGNFAAAGLPMESYVPDTRFYVLPIHEDVLRASMLKDAQSIRRSHYRYRITGRHIRIFPKPSAIIPGFNDALWVRVVFPQTAAPGILGSSFSGSVNMRNAIPDDTLFGASSPANIPMGLINYSSLNPWAKNWIFQYTFALCTELLGRVRSKMKSLPVGAADLQLNGDDLISQGREDKTNLKEELKGKLEELTYDKLAIRDAEKAEAEQRKLNLLPIPPSVILSKK